MMHALDWLLLVLLFVTLGPLGLILFWIYYRKKEDS